VPVPVPPPPAPATSGWWSELVGELARTAAAPGRLAALIGQAAVLGVLIVIAALLLHAGGPVDAPWLRPSRVAVAGPSWPRLAAVWFGLSNGAIGVPPGVPGARGSARLAAGFVVFGAVGLVQCLLAWAIVASGVGLVGAFLPTLVLLAAASAVGLALGLVAAA